MKSLEIFARVRLDDDRFCILYKTEDGRYLPVILYGDEAEMVEGLFSGSLSPCHERIIVFSKRAIEEVGATILYGEIYYDKECHGIFGRMVCRQQNDVNKIFSLVDSPIAYLIGLELPILTDDSTIDYIGLNDMKDASDLIGFDMAQLQGEENGKES